MTSGITRDPFPRAEGRQGGPLDGFRPRVGDAETPAKQTGETASPFPPRPARQGESPAVAEPGQERRSVQSAHGRRPRKPAANHRNEADTVAGGNESGRPRLTRARLAAAGIVLLAAIATAVYGPQWLADQALPAINPDYPGSFSVPAGTAVPEFSATLVQGSVDPYGNVFSNFDLYGRITVVLVWASWDPLSVEWLDQLQLMRLTRYYDEPINWLGVAFHDQMAAAQSIVDQTSTTDWPHLWLPQEPATASESLHQLGFSWVPGLYVFDAQGKLRSMGWSPAELPQILDELSE